MARLSLATRKLTRRIKYLAVLSFCLRPMYQYHFYERRKYIQKIIYASDSVCKNVIRMNRQAFVHLCSRLEAIMAMTVHILAHHQKQRIINANFERYGKTISRHFIKMINVIITLQGELLKTPKAVPDNSMDERWKWFRVWVLRSLDGTRIKVCVPIEDKPRYRTCKNEIATNVLGVRWEGSIADGRVLRDAISRRNDLVVPRDSYYLVDVGYTNSDGFFAERHQPTIAEEFFNMKSSSYYSIKIQNRIIMTCCLFQNFIRQEMGGGEHLNNNEVDEDEESITMIEPFDEWTTFRKNLAIDIFNTWRAQRNPR
ncbi:hypothetical protein Pfo_019022 [Paulownia fortunei]|nr:hypothetical protein Pfo_019022 [Paulownia fortunei]